VQITVKQTEQEAEQTLKNKIKICESEASETGYWLEISIDMKWSEATELESALNESNELLAIFTSIGKNLNL
jgi:four helix bundle protein